MEFGYWQIRGLGAVFRMLFEYKQADCKDSQYATMDEWFQNSKPRILELNPLANLPYLVDGDVCICQTNAILIYLGEKFGMEGKDAAKKRLNNELLMEIYDVRNGMIDLVYPFKQSTRDQAEFDEKAAKLSDGPPFGKFEAILTKYDTDYFCGAEPCTSDFHIWEMLDQHKMLGEKIGKGNVLEKFPKCAAFYDRFRALPTLQKYFDSPSYKLPINNQGAGPYFY